MPGVRGELNTMASFSTSQMAAWSGMPSSSSSSMSRTSWVIRWWPHPVPPHASFPWCFSANWTSQAVSTEPTGDLSLSLSLADRLLAPATTYTWHHEMRGVEKMLNAWFLIRFFGDLFQNRYRTRPGMGWANRVGSTAVSRGRFCARGKFLESLQLRLNQFGYGDSHAATSHEVAVPPRRSQTPTSYD